MTFARDLDFSGKSVLVTGAANGFGAATSKLLFEHGARLVLADREGESLNRIARELNATAHVYEQADPASIQRLAADVGEIDILINNAGILVAKPLLETSVEEIQQLVSVDFVGAALMMKLIGAGMVKRQRGVVLSIGSQTAFCGGENRAIYAAAKAAISQLTRSLAVEWGSSGVRVVCLAPGRALTRMTMTSTALPSSTLDRGLSRVPLGRWGTPEEIAKMIVFLVSDAASYVTGETVIADGGYVLG